MAYPTRLFEPGAAYFITNRCIQSRFLLRPSQEINRIVGGILARALSLFPVDLYAFTFAANHFHALVSTRDAATSISDFIAYLEANIARRVGNLVGWSGRFWHRRFSGEPVLDDAAFEQRLLYIFSHGVKEGLTLSCEDWPGLTCLPELLHGVVRDFDYVDLAGYHEALRMAAGSGEPVSIADFTTRHQLKLAVPPCWQGLTPGQRQARARELVAFAEKEACDARGDKPVLGVDAILAQDPLDAPLHSKKSPRPLCHASTSAGRETFRAAYRAFLDAYNTASELFRKGFAAVEFPPHCFRPPAPWGWRLLTGDGTHNGVPIANAAAAA